MKKLNKRTIKETPHTLIAQTELRGAKKVHTKSLSQKIILYKI